MATLSEAAEPPHPPNLAPDSPGPPAPGVRERLARILRLGGPPPVKVMEAVRAPLPSPPVARRRDSTSIPQVPREDRFDAYGRYSLGVLDLPEGHMHGHHRLSEVLAVGGRDAILLSGDPALADFRVEDALFFDLETTGLLAHREGEGPRGQRPMAFLVGSVRMASDGTARLTQWLFADPRDEGSVLQAFATELSTVKALVSFNGRSFDRHLLADRLQMHRMDGERLRTMPHLDLVHPARRLGRSVLPSCTLGQLEEAWLGVVREGDLPGALVPEAWNSWRRTGQWEWIAPVLDHNTLDLLSLVTLLVQLGNQLREPGRTLAEPAARCAAGRLLLDRGDVERGEAVLKGLLGDLDDWDAQDPVLYGAARVLAERWRRVDPASAHRVLQRMQAGAGGADPWPWDLAARMLERDALDPGAALVVVDRWLSVLAEAPGTWVADREAAERRRTRLLRRLG